MHVDHIIPKDKGGLATLDNGQTLCSICNFRKKITIKQKVGKKCLLDYGK